jgi:hypothetical protein
MTKANYQEMNRQELREYMLAHRDDDEVFYAYMDKLYEEKAAIKQRVISWLVENHPQQNIEKIPDKKIGHVMVDSEGKMRGIRIQTISDSLTNYQPLLEMLIQDLIGANNRTDLEMFLTVFVTKNQADSEQLDQSLTEANFDIRAKSCRVVGYMNAEGNFQRI